MPTDSTVQYFLIREHHREEKVIVYILLWRIWTVKDLFKHINASSVCPGPTLQFVLWFPIKIVPEQSKYVKVKFDKRKTIWNFFKFYNSKYY